MNLPRKNLGLFQKHQHLPGKMSEFLCLLSRGSQVRILPGSPLLTHCNHCNNCLTVCAHFEHLSGHVRTYEERYSHIWRLDSVGKTLEYFLRRKSS